MHGIDVKVEPVDLARVALKRPGLIGKSRQRDRRPTADEIKRLLDHFDGNRRLSIPMGRIVRFARIGVRRACEVVRQSRPTWYYTGSPNARAKCPASHSHKRLRWPAPRPSKSRAGHRRNDTGTAASAPVRCAQGFQQ
ncbi:hypothetical protein HNR76_002933 [Pseudoxanthomonas broegbernensis]|nr:hypothetical protein [Pseudoxanthomonas broegbernensis]MBB6066353.1 hypothetical protein [Pseudoxanthomonas broegbernensis]